MPFFKPDVSMYLCPLCQNPLLLHENRYQCLNNHSFDVAREGYVNLLPVQQKNSKDPGDNKDMMLARRQFLQMCAPTRKTYVPAP